MVFLSIILSWEIKKVPPKLLSLEQIYTEIVPFQKAQKPKQKQDEAEWREDNKGWRNATCLSRPSFVLQVFLADGTNIISETTNNLNFFGHFQFQNFKVIVNAGFRLLNKICYIYYCATVRFCCKIF